MDAVSLDQTALGAIVKGLQTLCFRLNHYFSLRSITLLFLYCVKDLAL